VAAAQQAARNQPAPPCCRNPATFAPSLRHRPLIMLVHDPGSNRKAATMPLFDGVGLAIALACGLLAVRVMAGV
jgi:hypothetical protein